MYTAVDQLGWLELAVYDCSEYFLGGNDRKSSGACMSMLVRFVEVVGGLVYELLFKSFDMLSERVLIEETG